MTLELIGKLYSSLCKALRKLYKWTPDVIDKIYVDRLLQIYHDLEEEAQNKDSQISEDDLE